MLDNEVLLRQVLRIYRNAIVDVIRSRLTAGLPQTATDDLAKLFGKKDAEGTTQWERMRINAERARATPEVSTTVDDDFELLGVADFYAVFDKFHDILFRDGAAPPSDVRKEHKGGLLRCMRQVKIMRDPTSHEVTQDIGLDELMLTGLNVVVVLKACDRQDEAAQVRETLLEAATQKPSLSVALVRDIGSSEAEAASLTRQLSARGVRVSQFEIAFEVGENQPLPALPSHSNLVPIISRLPEEGSPAALALNGIAARRNVVPVLLEGIDQDGWSRSANAIGVPSSARIAYHPDYLGEVAKRLVDRLQADTVTARRTDYSASVPIAKAVSDNVLRVRLADQLRQPELRYVYLVSPFASDVEDWTLNVQSLTILLSQLHQRGVKVTLITRPPSASEGYEVKRTFLTTLARNGVRVLLNHSLHAKIYLFEATGERVRWFVGSHNLTASGLGRLKEVSMEGYRPAEYREAENAMIKIRDHRLTKSFDIWTAEQARRGRISA